MPTEKKPERVILDSLLREPGVMDLTKIWGVGPKRYEMHGTFEDEYTATFKSSKGALKFDMDSGRMLTFDGDKWVAVAEEGSAADRMAREVEIESRKVGTMKIEKKIILESPDDIVKSQNVLAERLTSEFDRHAWKFRISGPCKVTAKLIAGTYIKTPFIGEEEFFGYCAYVGKRGKVIVAFRPNFPSDKGINSIEMDLSEACNNLEGFIGFYNGVLATKEDEEVAEIRRDAASKEEAADMAARGEKWGSW